MWKILRNSLLDGKSIQLSDKTIESEGLVEREISLDPVKELKLLKDSDPRIQILVPALNEEVYNPSSTFTRMRAKPVETLFSSEMCQALEILKEIYPNNNLLVNKTNTLQYFINKVSPVLMIFANTDPNSELSLHNESSSLNSKILGLNELISSCQFICKGKNSRKPVQKWHAITLPQLN